MQDTMKRSMISDISYYGSNCKSISDMKQMYDDGVLYSNVVDSRYPVTLKIEGILDGIESRLKTRMSHLTLGIYHALQDGPGKNLQSSEEMYLFTAFAEIETTRQIIHDIVINKSKLVSPTLFHNSVHNTPLGYYTIINKIHNFCTTVSDGLETDFSFSRMLDYKNRLGDSYIVAAGDEYSDFYQLDRDKHIVLPPFYTAYRITSSSESGFAKLAAVDTKTALYDVLRPYKRIVVPGALVDDVKKALPEAEIITDYPFAQDQPMGSAARLSLPFALYLTGSTAVITASGESCIVYDVRL